MDLSEVSIVKNEEEKYRNPDSKVSSGLCEKAKGDLTGGALALFHKLGLGRPLGRPWHPAGNKKIGRSLWI